MAKSIVIWNLEEIAYLANQINGEVTFDISIDNALDFESKEEATAYIKSNNWNNQFYQPYTFIDVYKEELLQWPRS